MAFAQAPGPAKSKLLGNVDVRVESATPPSGAAGKSAAQRTRIRETQAAATQRGLARLKASVPGAEVTLSPVTDAPEVVRATQGLTAAAPGQSGTDIVRGFVQENSALYGLAESDVAGLHFIGESVSPGSGLKMVRVEQTVNGRPVFQSETRFTLDKNGRLFRSVGIMVPNAADAAPPLAGLISAPQALQAAMASVGIAADAAAMTTGDANAEGTKLEVTANHPDIQGAVQSEIVYFPLGPGELVPAWSQVAFTSGDSDWYTLVDARTGTLLWRKDIRAHASTEEARFSVYVQADGKTPADSPSPLSPSTATVGSNLQPPAIARSIVSMLTAQDPIASPNGWIADGGNTTTGNNVDAYLDRNSNNAADPATLDFNGRPVGNLDADNRARDFLGTNYDYTPPPNGDPEVGSAPTDAQHQRGVVTHLFYLVNWYHDQLFNLGFDEAAGNFQTQNFSAMGLGSDPVRAECQDAAGNTATGSNRNNANFSTAPDGQPPRMQMYIFSTPTVDRDGSLDAEIVLHELTHGLSNRLVGNAAGLLWNPAQGMGEGWSDFYALSLLNNTNADDPNGQYASGAYATFKLANLLDNYVYGIRRFPYSTDNVVNPLTWADVDDVTNDLTGGIATSPINFNGSGGFEVHNIGEIWALTLWEVRSRIIADPSGANGNVPTGNHTSLQLVTDALKMTPINPTFTNARDALLDADMATNSGANEDSIWAGFADRGLGYKATDSVAISGRYVSAHQGIKESFSVPYLDVVNPATDVTIDDSATNNTGGIDPGETVRLTVKLTNPWRKASKTVNSVAATLTSATPGVTIYNGNAVYGQIAPQGTALGTSFVVNVSPAALAGQSLDFTLSTVSTLGTTSASFSLRVGTASGTGAPITYTSVIGPAATITSSAPRGVANSLAITDDFEIADIDFRVDGATGPAVGDFSFMLRAPNGYGVDLITLIDGLNDLGGTSIVNMVIDDDLPATAANDMIQATVGAAPYTKSWLPVYNSPWAAIVNPAAPADPVGQLGRLDKTSTKGTWTVLAADNFSTGNGGANGNGTFSGWSLIVTPKTFATQAVTPANSVTGTQSVSGDFKQGGTVTYTVVLTNSGNSLQADNTGDEFSEVLPASLTLVSADATSGQAATPGGNTVTWNGTLAPFGGSVTITITAKVKAGTGGDTISAQGTISYDADADATNEATKVTDDPSVGGAADPTTFSVPAVTHLAFFAGKKGLTFDPLAFDPAPGLGQTFTITSVTVGANGIVIINPDGTLTYIPNIKKLPFGGDKFTYTVSDQNGTVYEGEITVRDFADGLGVYNGLVQAAIGVTPSNACSGLLRVTTTKTGMFTASLRLATDKFSIKGKLDVVGAPKFGKTATATAVLKRKVAKGQPALPDLIFAFQVTQNTDLDALTGTLTEGGNPFAAFAADRALFTSKKNPAVPLMPPPADLIRKYTLYFSKPVPNGILGADKFPQGEGAGIMALDKNGVIKLVARLADGQTVSAANPLSRNNEWPFYAALFKGKGSVLGTVTFQETLGISDFDGVAMNWFKPAGLTKQKYYPDGWAAGIKTDLRGSIFNLPPKGVVASVLPGLATTGPAGNADFLLSDGELPPPGTDGGALNVDPKNKITPADGLNGPPPDLKLKLGFKKTGLVGGKFVHPVSTKSAPITGVIIQKQGRVFGSFLGPTQAGEMILTPK